MAADYSDIIERLDTTMPSDDPSVLITLFCAQFRGPENTEIVCLFINAIKSIDAAVALVERMLNIYSLDICIDPSGNGATINWWPNGLSGKLELGPFEGVAVTPEAAILLALFRALRDAQREERDR